MKSMLDTNICIYIIKQQPATVMDRLLKSPAENIGISVITVGELRYVASKSKRPKRNHDALDQFFSPLEIAAFDNDAATAYGTIRTAVEKKGRPIGPMDLLIAAHALSLGVGLVTNNVREFAQVPGLRVENWGS